MRNLLITSIFICLSIRLTFADAPKIFHAAFENTNGVTRLQLGWKSQHGAHYKVESATSLNGSWTVVTNGVDIEGRDYISELTAVSTNATVFYRVSETDGNGPEIIFANPIKDATDVSSNSEIRINFNDVSSIEKDSVILMVGDLLVATNNIVWDGNTLIYTAPDGKLGEPGQEIDICVSAIDSCGNNTTKKSTVVLSQPLKQKVVSLMVIGEEGVTPNSYVGINGNIEDRPEIKLVGLTTNELIISGVSEADLYTGQLYASMIPTNGFYRRAVGVLLLSNDVYKIETTDASLSDFISGTLSTNNVNIIQNGGGCSITDLLGESSRNSTVDKNIGFSKMVEIEFPKDFTVGKTKILATAHYGTITLNGRVGVSGNFNDREERIDVFFTGQIVLEHNPSLNVDISFPPIQLPLPHVSFPICVFAIPTPIPIPIVVTGEVMPEISVYSSCKGSIVLAPHYTQIGDAQLHLCKGKAGWKCCDDTSFSWSSFVDGTESDIEVTAEGEVEVHVDTKFAIGLDKLVYPYLSIDPYLSFRGIDQGTWLRLLLEAGINGQVGMEVGYPGFLSVGIPFVKSDPHSKIIWDSMIDTAPPLIEIAERFTVKEGDPILLKPIISGTGPISTVWYRKGIPVVNGSEISFVASQSASGEYTLIASNSYGTDSKTVTVDVEEFYTNKWVGVWECSRSFTRGPEEHSSKSDYYYNRYSDRCGEYAGWTTHWQDSTMQRVYVFRLTINEDMTFDYSAIETGNDYLHTRYNKYDEYDALIECFDIEAWYELRGTTKLIGKLCIVEDENGEKTHADGAFKSISQHVTVETRKGIDRDGKVVNDCRRYPGSSADPTAQSTALDGMRLISDDEMLWVNQRVWRRVK